MYGYLKILLSVASKVWQVFAFLLNWKPLGFTVGQTETIWSHYLRLLVIVTGILVTRISKHSFLCGENTNHYMGILCVLREEYVIIYT